MQLDTFGSQKIAKQIILALLQRPFNVKSFLRLQTNFDHVQDSR